MANDYSEREIEKLAYKAIWEFIPDSYRDDALTSDDVEHKHSDRGIHTLHVTGSPLGDLSTTQIYQAEVGGKQVQFTVDSAVGLGQFEIRFTPSSI